MTNNEFIEKAKNIAQNYKTAYVWGCFGWPVTAANVTRAVNSYPSYNTKRQETLNALVGKGYYMFDCIGLIKALLWGWSGNSADSYGGAKYAANGVPDMDANGMIQKCSGVSTDFSSITPGEVVWMNDHIGIYIGSGKVVEATSAWSDGVQITACQNVGTISGLNGRSWTKHGKMPYITYESASAADTEPSATQANEPSSWAKEAWDWAIAAGITDGTNPKGTLTREQGVTMLYRMQK